MAYNFIKTISSIVFHPGNKGKRIDAFMRYFKWQIGSRLLGFVVVFNWIDDAKLYMRTGEAMVTHNYYTGLYEYYDMSFLMHYTNDGDKFLDVGANAGVYSILASVVLDVDVVAFEPIPETFERLTENIRLNKKENDIKYLNIGLSDKKGALYFTCDRDATNHVSENLEEENTIKVEVTTLDEELGRLHYSPSIMKIDVEGYEKFVLNGASLLLANPALNVIVVELNESGARYKIADEEIVAILTRNGFIAYDYYPNKHELVKLENCKSERQNTLFIRNIDLARERVNNVKKNFVHSTKSYI